MNGQTEQELRARIERLEGELEQLKRDLLRIVVTAPVQTGEHKPSLFGSVRGGDIAAERIEEAKRGLFRDLRDL